MANNALRSLFIFYNRFIIFLDYTIQQLSIAQENLAAAAKSIDASTTEKRNLRAILDAMEENNKAIGCIIGVKAFFIKGFSRPFHRTVADNEPLLAASMGPSDWSPSVGAFSMFLEDMDRLAEIEGTFDSLNLLLLSHMVPGIDLTAVQILQLVIAINLAAESTYDQGKTFAILQAVSLSHDCVEEGLVQNIRELADEIQDLLCQVEAGFSRIRRNLEDCVKVEEEP
ncbi:MAG TPA: hypothetical protein VHR47_05180 [Bacillota bacterium]|nr:hypothetical protein [Bacillota bacterium]